MIFGRKLSVIFVFLLHVHGRLVGMQSRSRLYLRHNNVENSLLLNLLKNECEIEFKKAPNVSFLLAVKQATC